MVQRLRAWLRDELTRVVRDEISQTSAALEHRLDAGIAEIHTDVVAHRDALEDQRQSSETKLADAIEQLATALNALHQRLDADNEERQLHLSSVEWLMRELIISFPQPDVTQPTVLGGTIERDAMAVTSDGDVLGVTALSPSEEIDLREAERTVGMLVEVRSRFHDQWIRGFEIHDIVDVGHVRRFRLKRISDRMALPVLFDSADIRPLPTNPESLHLVDVELRAESEGE